MIPSISPTCSGAAMETYSVRSPAAGPVDWCACLRIVCTGGAAWPWFAINGGVADADENLIGGSWARA